MPHQNAPSSAVGYCWFLLITIEKRYERERTRAYFTRKSCMDPAKDPDTSERLFLALCGVSISSCKLPRPRYPAFVYGYSMGDLHLAWL